MITIEPPSTTSVSAHNSGTPHLDSERCASPGGRPSSSRRKRTLTLVGVILLATTLHAQSPNWQLTWSDEFNAPNGSPPDPAKWVIVTGGKGFGNNELETYTTRPANVQQQNGNLVITAQKEDLIGPDGVPRHYTSARLNTQSHFAQKYGRFEARIQLPTGKGIWPAFWLLGDNFETVDWPDCGEIDILETIGVPDTMYSTLHGPRLQRRQRHLSQIPSAQPASPSTTPSISTPSSGHRTTSSFFFDDHLIAHAYPSRPAPQHQVGLRPPVLHPPESRRRRQLARQPRRHHHLPAADARRLRPRLLQRTRTLSATARDPNR